MIELEFKQFRYHLNALRRAEEQLTEVARVLNGENLKSPAIKSKDEAFYTSSPQPYKNNICELMYQEEQLIQVRNYHLFAERKIMHYLQQLDPEEVELMEMRFWYGYSIRVCASNTYQSKRTVSRKLNNIYEKLKKQAFI